MITFIICLAITLALYAGHRARMRTLARRETERRAFNQNAALRNAHAHHMAASSGHPAGRALREGLDTREFPLR